MSFSPCRPSATQLLPVFNLKRKHVIALILIESYIVNQLYASASLSGCISVFGSYDAENRLSIPDDAPTAPRPRILGGGAGPISLLCESCDAAPIPDGDGDLFLAGERCRWRRRSESRLLILLDRCALRGDLDLSSFELLCLRDLCSSSGEWSLRRERWPPSRRLV